MENSFVTLDLEKYNEMYEKAKKNDELNNSNEKDNRSDYKIGDKVLIRGVISEIDNDDAKMPYEIEHENGFFWVSKNDICKKEDE